MLFGKAGFAMMAGLYVALAPAAVIAQVAPPSQSLQGRPSALPGQTTFTFCNRAAERVYIALVYFNAQSSKWTLTAWFAREPGACGAVGTFRTGPTYYHAYSQSRRSIWPTASQTARNYCVPPVRVERTVLPGNCAPGEQLARFSELNPRTRGLTVNLNVR